MVKKSAVFLYVLILITVWGATNSPGNKTANQPVNQSGEAAVATISNMQLLSESGLKAEDSDTQGDGLTYETDIMQISNNEDNTDAGAADSVPGIEDLKLNLSSLPNVKNFGAKGDGITDDTAAIQSAINDTYAKGGGTIYIPEGTYLINPVLSVKLKSNVNLYIADDATLKAQATTNDTYAVVKIGNVSNVKVIGGNIVGERDIHLGTGGEWGHGISITGSKDIYVADVNVSDCWGDGIYIGSNSVKNYSTNIYIERFNIDRARRNGISVISGINVTIKDGIISNTNGTAPQCGICLEPNTTTEFLQNILIEDVTAINSVRSGVLFGLKGYVSTPNDVTVTLKNFVNINSGKAAYNDYKTFMTQNPSFDIRFLQTE